MSKCIVDFFSKGDVPTQSEIKQLFPKMNIGGSVGFIDIDSPDHDRSVLLGTGTKGQLKIFVIEDPQKPWLKKIIKSAKEWDQLKLKLINFLHNGISKEVNFEGWEKN